MSDGYQQLTVKDSYLVGKPLLYFTTCFVSVGVLLFGFEQGVMSGLLTNALFKDYFNDPSSAAIGTMVAILEIGALITSLLSGKLSDKFGRRRTIRYGSFIFFIGGVIQCLSTSFKMLTFARLISGFGVGLLTSVVPVYQTEISPPHSRGRLACVEFTGNIIGYASSVWSDYFCSFLDSNLSWRIPLSIQALIALVLFCGSYIIVESPRWLLSHDHDAEGIVVIADLIASGDVSSEVARNEFRDIKETVLIHRLEGESSYSYMFKRYKKRVFIATSAQAFAQLNGINVISYYAPLVFEQAGWLGRDALLMTGFNSIFYVLSTLIPVVVIDKWGRRPILLSGSIIMGLSLTAISYALFINTEKTRHLVVLLVFIFNAGFGFSWGPIGWLIGTEISPSSIRAKVSSLSTASNWIFNWLVGEMTPILQEMITWRLYLIHSTSCFVSCFIVFYYYPETAGVSLEDMDSLFDDKSATASNYSSSASSLFNYQSQSGANNNEHLSSAAIQRQPSTIANDTPLSKVTSNKQTSLQVLQQNQLQSQFLQDIEPPQIEEIIRFKNDIDRNSIASSIRRSSATVSSAIGKVFKPLANNASATGNANDDENNNVFHSDQESV